MREAFPREFAEETAVFRKDLIELLLMRPMSIQQIARLLEERPRDVEDDLHHLLRSLKKRAPTGRWSHPPGAASATSAFPTTSCTSRENAPAVTRPGSASR